MNQKYSVLMSLYDKEEPAYLSQSLDSMVSQTIQPDEIVLVLDGPINMNLQEILSNFLKEYPEVLKVVPLRKNIGLGLALNEGLKVCKNDLIVRMDTDDIAYPNRVEMQLREFNNNPSLDILGTLTSEFYETPDKIISSRIVPENHSDIVKFSKRRSPFNHPTVMYKKYAVEEVGGYRDIIRNEDLDLFARMLDNGSKAKNLQIPLLYFRSNADNYKRRKSWDNCSNYIRVIYSLWKKGYSSTFDLIYVIFTQLGMFISPTWLVKYVSDNFLRSNLNN